MNFAFFVISTELGGAEKSLLDFLREFKKQQHNIKVITPKKTGPLIEELKELQIDIIPLNLPPFFLALSRKRIIKTLFLLIPAFFYIFIYLFRMHKTIKDNSLNVVHSTGLKYHILLCLISLFHPQYHFHIHIRDIINILPIKLFFSFFNQRKNIHFIFNSKVTAQALPSIKPLVIYNGFDSQKLSPGSSSLKKDLSIPDDTLLIGIVAVIAHWKGQRQFLQMAYELTQKYPSTQFVIVGDEIYDTHGEKGELAQLKKLQRELNLNNSVHFLGFQKNIENIYRGLDILVHGSIAPEPFGRVLVEAMLCGCPAVAANQGGPLEIIHDKKNGFLYQQAHIDSLVQVVSNLIEDKNLRKEISHQARQRGEFFSLKNYVDSLSTQLNKN